MGLLDGRQVGDDAGIRQLLARVTRIESDLQMVAAASSGAQAQVAYLTARELHASTDATLYSQHLAGPMTSVMVPFDPDRSVALQVTTSGTGRLLVDATCQWSTTLAAGVPIDVSWTLVVEIVDSESEVVLGYSTGAPQSTTTVKIPTTSGTVNMQLGAVVHDEVTLSPDTTYLAQARIYVARIATDNAIDIAPISLTITKLGM